MFTSLVLLISGAAFLFFSFQKTFRSGHDAAADKRGRVACPAAGVVTFLAVAGTYLGGESTQTTFVSVSWFLAAVFFVLSVIFLIAKGLDGGFRIARRIT